jgi:hypothetical protein
MKGAPRSDRTHSFRRSRLRARHNRRNVPAGVVQPSSECAPHASGSDDCNRRQLFDLSGVKTLLLRFHYAIIWGGRIAVLEVTRMEKVRCTL